MAKVAAAAETLEAGGHNLRSQIETVHIDAVEQWPTVVELAQR
jgi:hypothetical protein